MLLVLHIQQNSLYPKQFYNIAYIKSVHIILRGTGVVVGFTTTYAISAYHH